MPLLQPPGVDEVPHHAPLVGEGLRKVHARAVQLTAAAAHAVDHLRAARPQAYYRAHAELGHVLLALGPRGVHALQRAPQRRRVHVAPRGDAQHITDNRFKKVCYFVLELIKFVIQYIKNININIDGEKEKE